MSDYLRALASRAAIPNNQRAILVALCDAAGEDDGTSCYPSQEYLAYKSRYSVRQVRRILETLEGKKYISSRVADYTGWGHNTSYRIYIDRVPMVAPWAEVKAKIRRRTKPEPVRAAEISPDILSAVSPDILSAVSPDILSAVSPDILSGDSKYIPYDEPSLISKDTLAPSAEPATPAPQAPPERRTRKKSFDLTALKRDPLIQTLAACFGREPVTWREWDQWRLAVNDMHASGIVADDIPRAIRGYQAAFGPKSRITPFALVKHWSDIQEGKPHDLAQLEIARRASAAENERRSEQERLARERRTREADEVERYMREHGYGARA